MYLFSEIIYMSKAKDNWTRKDFSIAGVCIYFTVCANFLMEQNMVQNGIFKIVIYKFFYSPFLVPVASLHCLNLIVHFPT